MTAHCYGSITSKWGHFTEWKRLDETDKGSLEAEVLLNGMLAHDRLLDIIENFILFDTSKPDGTRKVIGRNHQVLGVNRAVASVARQESLKREFPPEERLRHRIVELPLQSQASAQNLSAPRMVADAVSPYIPQGPVDIVERSHPDLGQLGVFWHTQGSGKSYSMAFFTEKVRRKLEGNFTFLLMTDRNDLDSQIYKTFVGCSHRRRQDASGRVRRQLGKRLLKENHRYVFSLIHKFNKDVDPKQPYSERDNIIVISDEAHIAPKRGGWRATCASRCRTRPSSGSPARRSSNRTNLPSASLATTSLDTISSDQRRTARPSSWFTKTGARSWALRGRI